MCACGSGAYSTRGTWREISRLIRCEILAEISRGKFDICHNYWYVNCAAEIDRIFYTCASVKLISFCEAKRDLLDLYFPLWQNLCDVSFFKSSVHA